MMRLLLVLCCVFCCVLSLPGLAGADSLRLPGEAVPPASIPMGTVLPDTPEAANPAIVRVPEAPATEVEVVAPKASEEPAVESVKEPDKDLPKEPEAAKEPAKEPGKEQAPRTILDILADVNKPQPKPGEALSIPEKAANTEFLEGKWRCKSGLVNSKTDEPVMVDFTFAKDGTGTAEIREKSGRVFTGEATASLKDGVLHIAQGELVSQGAKGRYSAGEIECRQKGKQAQCAGKNAALPGVGWQGATFTRVN